MTAILSPCVLKGHARSVSRVVSQLARRTPLLECDELNARVGGRVLLKAECLQVTGSFKLRGAWYALSRLPKPLRRAGVLGMSSGNHAQGLAFAARHLGIPATLVMPVGAPKVKVDKVRAFGAEVVFFDGPRDDWDSFAQGQAELRGQHYVHSYDDPNIVLGQATVGVELLAQAKAMRVVPDLLLSPCGGGGLTAGCCLAVEAFAPGVRVLSVEPAALNDMQRSLRSGRREENATSATSICDALRARRPGQATFEVISRVAAGGLAVDDADTVAAMSFAARALKLVLEPGGAVGLAALLSGAIELRGRCAAVVLSGGNVEPQLHCDALSGSGGWRPRAAA
ncbi:threonine ammonia-lyase [Phenylobacterium sp.]|uniref:threonine ammonia-lyase n=1 Tax=Phenylobacterium sp. TaxID=1871053 RepID=UPI002FCA18FF